VDDCVKWFTFAFVSCSILNVPASQLYYWIRHHKLNPYSFDTIFIILPSIFIFIYTLYLSINMSIEISDAKDSLEDKIGKSKSSEREQSFLVEVSQFI
jgi:hypothetical protein